MAYKLQDLIDIGQFQILQDRLNEIYCFPSAIIDNDGNILTATAWQEVCTQFHRKHPDSGRECHISDLYILSHLHEANPAVSYRCPHGLVDNATPIIIDGIHYGNFFTGQFFLEPPDLEFFKAQARKYGFEEEPYLAAVRKVPVWSPDQLNSYLFFIKGLIAIISESGLKKLKEIESRKAIESTERRANIILETAMDGFWSVDLEGRLHSVNEAYCRMSGYAAGELVQMRITDFEAREMPEETQAHMEKLLATGQDRFETRHRRKDGGVYDVEISVQYRPEARPPIYAFLRDITEKKRAEQELRKSEEKFRTLFESAADAIIIHDGEGRILAANRAGCENYGYAPAEFMAINAAQIDTPEESVHLPERIARLMAQGVIQFETEHQRKDGTVLPVEVKARRITWDRQEAVMSICRDITQRKLAEAALREANRLVEESQSVARLGTYTLDIAAGIWTSSRVLDEVFGIPGLDYAHDIEGWVGIVHPADRRAMQEYFIQEVVGQKKSFNREYRIVRHNDGAERWVHGLGRLDINPEGKAARMIGSIQDITERKQAELAMRESEERFRTLIEQAGDGVELLDLEGRYVGFNAATLRQLGYTREEMAGLTLFDVDIQLRREDYVSPDLPAQAGSPLRLESVHRRKDGTTFPVEIIASAIQLGGVRHNLAVVRDITERKRAEEQIRKLSSAVEQSPASIVITDPAGAIEYVNPTFTRVTGFTLEEVRGRNPRVLKGDKTSAEEYRQMWQAITQGREWRGELHNRKKNGDLYWEFALISPIVDQQGRITHFLAVKEDITEQKALAEQLRQAQKLESIGQLAGGVAHDFNNLLAAMMMNLGGLQEDPGLDQETQQMLAELMAVAQRAADLTRQLLMFSRRSVLEKKTLDMNEVVANLLRMLERLIGEHIRVRFDRREGLPLIEADPGMLEQVLLNLAVNARDAMPRGGQLGIRLEALPVDEARAQPYPGVRPGGFICLTVSDTGCGMDEATRKRIFEPFFTTKEVGRGTGLGLATVHGIVGQHQGWVEVESEPGKGATFRIYLPAGARPERPRLRAEETRVDRGQETILLVEDEESVRRFTAKSLRRLGYRVVEAASGPEALKAWDESQGQIDLLMSDMMMPEGMTGLDLAEKLQAMKPGLKVIISSGYSAEIVDQGLPAGRPILRLQKPYHLKTLAKAIRECLGPGAEHHPGPGEAGGGP